MSTLTFKHCLQEAVAMGRLSEIDIQLTPKALLAYWDDDAMFEKVCNEPEELQTLAKGEQELAIKKAVQRSKFFWTSYLLTGLLY